MVLGQGEERQNQLKDLNSEQREAVVTTEGALRSGGDQE
jgi:hypothetical protein